MSLNTLAYSFRWRYRKRPFYSTSLLTPLDRFWIDQLVSRGDIDSQTILGVLAEKATADYVHDWREEDLYWFAYAPKPQIRIVVETSLGLHVNDYAFRVSSQPLSVGKDIATLVKHAYELLDDLAAQGFVVVKAPSDIGYVDASSNMLDAGLSWYMLGKVSVGDRKVQRLLVSYESTRNLHRLRLRKYRTDEVLKADRQSLASHAGWFVAAIGVGVTAYVSRPSEVVLKVPDSITVRVADTVRVDEPSATSNGDSALQQTLKDKTQVDQPESSPSPHPHHLPHKAR